MSKPIIVANTKRQADLIAKMHDLRPWQWRYAFTPQSLHGVSKGTTVLMAADYQPRPRNGEVIATELRMLQSLGVIDLVMVAT